MANRTGRRSSGERGAVAVLVAVLIVVLFGFAALVVDLGRLFRARGELQNASDSAALAGAQELDRTAEGLTRARSRAQEYAAKHWAHDGPVAIADVDVLFGHWDESAKTFTSLGTDPDDPAVANAVHVIDRREEATDNAIPFFLGQFITGPTGNVNSQAIAVGGGPASACGFPMVVSDCSLDGVVADGSCEYCMTFQDNNSDNAGWTSFETGSVGGPTIASLVTQSCYDEQGNVAIDPDTGECAGQCVGVDTGAEIQVQNGNLMNQGGNNFCPVIEDILRRGIANGTPQPFLVTVPVLQSDSGTCSADQFSSAQPIAGFAVMEILGVRCGNNSQEVVVPSPPCAPPPSGKYVVARLRCDLTSTEPAGGGFYGLETRRTRLIR